jgi:hypothetical protein
MLLQTAPAQPVITQPITVPLVSKTELVISAVLHAIPAITSIHLLHDAWAVPPPAPPVPAPPLAPSVSTILIT